MKEIIEQAKETVGAVTEKLIDLKDDFWNDEQKLIAEEFKDQGVGKIQEILSRLNSAEDFFERAGFKPDGYTVSLGLPPQISTKFTLLKEIDEQDRENIMKEAEEKKIIKLVLTCLFKANDFCGKMQLGENKLETITVALGLIPGITVFMKK